MSVTQSVMCKLKLKRLVLNVYMFVTTRYNAEHMSLTYMLFGTNAPFITQLFPECTGENIDENG